MKNTTNKPMTDKEANETIRRYLEKNPTPLCDRRGAATRNKTGRTSWATLCRTGR